MAQAGLASYDADVATVGTVILAGAFTPAGSGAPTDITGLGFTVARAGTGVWRVTITRPCAGFVNIPVCSILYNDILFHEVRPSALTPASGSDNAYFDITHLTSANITTTTAAAADITASGQLRRIGFVVHLATMTCPGNGV